MHIRLLAVGDRQPSWVNEACERYFGRFPRAWSFQLHTISTIHRSKNDKSRQALNAESEGLMSRLQPDEQLILLDESGTQMSSIGLAAKLADWQRDGQNLCFVIGGPEGVSQKLRKRADTIWSLSLLTLPHGLARVLLAEQLYRAWSLETGHPYHRE